MSKLSSLRDFAKGKINESMLNDDMQDKGFDFENDEAFIQECMTDCIGLIMQTELMDESVFDTLDEDTQEAFMKVMNYMANNGMIDEAAVSLNNPKISVVRMSKQAQMKRLTSIIALKMARKTNMKQYKKYKLGQKIKKENFNAIMQRFGDKAGRLAKKLVMQAKKGKVGAVIDAKKAERSKEKFYELLTFLINML